MFSSNNNTKYSSYRRPDMNNRFQNYKSSRPDPLTQFEFPSLTEKEIKKTEAKDYKKITEQQHQEMLTKEQEEMSTFQIPPGHILLQPGTKVFMNQETNKKTSISSPYQTINDMFDKLIQNHERQRTDFIERNGEDEYNRLFHFPRCQDQDEDDFNDDKEYDYDDYEDY